jgi:hypothetical protein
VLHGERRFDFRHMSAHGEKGMVCWLCRWKHIPLIQFHFESKKK